MLDQILEDRQLTVLSDGEIKTLNLHSFKGKNLILIFYPYDFTTICPTEISAFSKMKDKFDVLNATVLFISTDSVHSHNAWIQSLKESINFCYPMVSDFNKEFSKSLGLLEKEGCSMRATIITDIELKVKHFSVNNKNIGRSTVEVYRLLGAIVENYKTGNMMLVDHKSVCDLGDK